MCLTFSSTAAHLHYVGMSLSLASLFCLRDLAWIHSRRAFDLIKRSYSSMVVAWLASDYSCLCIGSHGSPSLGLASGLMSQLLFVGQQRRTWASRSFFGSSNCLSDCLNEMVNFFLCLSCHQSLSYQNWTFCLIRASCVLLLLFTEASSFTFNGQAPLWHTSCCLDQGKHTRTSYQSDWQRRHA